MIINTYPLTYQEVGYRLAELEHRPWYLISRDEVIGITAELEAGDGIISVYEPE